MSKAHAEEIIGILWLITAVLIGSGFWFCLFIFCGVSSILAAAYYSYVEGKSN